MHSMPRQKHLAGVLRGRKPGAIKDRRIPRGGAHNEQRELMEEAEMRDVECGYCGSYIYDVDDSICFNGGSGEFYAHKGACAQHIVDSYNEAQLVLRPGWVPASDCLKRG